MPHRMSDIMSEYVSDRISVGGDLWRKVFFLWKTHGFPVGNYLEIQRRAQMAYSESGWCFFEAVASRLGDRVVARPWIGPAPCLSFPTMPWLCKVHFGGYLVAREAGSISRSK